MLLQYALRNVLRNRKRTLLTALSVFTAAFIVCLAEGWINGLINNYIESTATWQSGHIRITSQGFLQRERFLPVNETLNNRTQLIEKLKQVQGVKRIEERIRIRLLLGHGSRTIHALGIAVDLNYSRLNLPGKLKGKTSRLDTDGLYPGKELAAKLGIKPGQKLLLATRTASGGMNGIKLPVRQIVETGIGDLDKRTFFFSLDQARKLLRLGNAATEIYIYLEDYSLAPQVIKKINNTLPPHAAARTLRQQTSGLYDYFMSVRKVWFLVDAFILFLASFVIINTMMMAVFERIREIGTMKALGMNQRQIFADFTLEGAMIGMAGGTAGTLSGSLLLAILNRSGVNMQKALSSVSIPFDYIIRPEISAGTIFTALLLSLLVPAVTAMIPALYTRKLQAAEALRKI